MLKFVSAVILGGLFFIGIGLVFASTQPRYQPENSVVEVSDATGHGSGFYIGGGRYITAGHVGETVGNKMTLKFEHNGTVEEITGFVTWVDKATDTAMIVGEQADGMEPANLACGVPDDPIGTPIVSIGYPLFLGLTHAWGKVAGPVAVRGNDKIKGLITDLTIAPGNSGGPVFDNRGYVVGLSDSIPIVHTMMGALTFPLSSLVPRSEICRAIHAHHAQPVAG